MFACFFVPFVLCMVVWLPPVISPELVREVESRMNRSHLPPKFPPATTHVRPKCYTRSRKPSQLAIVEEGRRVTHVGKWVIFIRKSFLPRQPQLHTPVVISGFQFFSMYLFFQKMKSGLGAD